METIISRTPIWDGSSSTPISQQPGIARVQASEETPLIGAVTEHTQVDLGGRCPVSIQNCMSELIQYWGNGLTSCWKVTTLLSEPTIQSGIFQGSMHAFHSIAESHRDMLSVPGGLAGASTAALSSLISAIFNMERRAAEAEGINTSRAQRFFEELRDYLPQALSITCAGFASDGFSVAANRFSPGHILQITSAATGVCILTFMLFFRWILRRWAIGRGHEEWFSAGPRWEIIASNMLLITLGSVFLATFSPFASATAITGIAAEMGFSLLNIIVTTVVVHSGAKFLSSTRLYSNETGCEWSQCLSSISQTFSNWCWTPFRCCWRLL